MRVLLTGADGYIGAIMGPKLIEAGHEVVGLDTGFYRRGWLFDDGRTHPAVISKDQRRITVGRPAGLRRGRAPGRALERPDRRERPRPDHGRSTTRARSALAAQGARGRRQALHPGLVLLDLRRRRRRDAHRDRALAPQTAYARCKILVEEGVRALMDDDFTPVFMRNATAYGASPRQRFDLVLNNLCGFAHTIGEIRMTSDGSPWRPITHIEDICEAMLCALKAPTARRSPARRSTSAPTARTTGSARSPRSSPAPSPAAS